MKRKRQSIGVKINPVDLMHTATVLKAKSFNFTAGNDFHSKESL